MARLMMHCKGEAVELNALNDIEMPEATDTYVPVSHYDLATNIQKVAGDLLGPKGYELDTTEYGLAREGQRMFGVLGYRNGDEEMGMCVGFRNSYDKSMAAGVVIGARVFICDNLAFSGDIQIMRKHTKNVKDDLIQDIIQALYKSVNNFEDIQTFAANYAHVEINDNQAYKMIGLLQGMGIITSTIANEAFRQWDHPKYDVFQARTVWSLYNAVTEALKAAPPAKVLQSHVDTHKTFSKEFGDCE